ncbi:MAG TPA: response regulator [Acidimicrobiales bacterium]|nr:response regulator [Acidimicrobiales bacterium]
MATLICDDDWRMRLLYRQEFEWAGVEVLEASDGDQCIEVAKREHPDLIILDLAMPRRGGLSALPELRACCPETPVLVVTAHAAVEVLSRTRELGATACYSKPGFLARIPDVVERYGLVSGDDRLRYREPMPVLSSAPRDDAAAS